MLFRTWLENMKSVCRLNSLRPSRRRSRLRKRDAVNYCPAQVEVMEPRCLLSAAASPPAALLLDVGAGGVLTDLGKTANGNELYEVQNFATNDIQLWKTNGKASGTALLQDFGVGNIVNQMASTGNGRVVLEVINGATNDVQLWVSNGTVSGTSLIQDFGTAGISLNSLYGLNGLPAAVNGEAVFTVYNNSTSDKQLWASKGTASSTMLIRDFGTGFNSQLSNVAVIDLGTTGNGNELLSVAKGITTSPDDRQLWATNGTASGTVLVHDFGVGVALSHVGASTNGRVLIEATTFATNGVQLWGSNGRASGTALLHDFGTHGFATLFDFGTAASGNELIAFNSSDSTGRILGFQLWASNGKSSGTALLHDFGENYVAGQGFYTQFITGNGDAIFVTVNHTTNDVQLWGTDGTTAGTALLHDYGTEFVVSYGANGYTVQTTGLIYLATAGNGKAIIEAINFITNDVQLWGTDGTVFGTSLVEDFGTAGVYLYAVGTTGSGESLVEVVNPTTNDVQLWGTDGTAGGTSLLHDFDAINSPLGALPLVFVAEAGNGNAIINIYNANTLDSQLWGTDGTAAGTVLLQDFGTTNTGFLYLGRLTNGDVLIEAVIGTTYDVQLWRSNGTLAGTSLVHEFGGSIDANSFINLGTARNGDVLIEVLNYTTSDVQLWRTDGTAAGTSLVHDFGVWSFRMSLTLSNLGTTRNRDVLIEVMDNSTYAFQLWSIA